MTAVPAQWASLVEQAASGTGLPQSVVAAQINEESGFQPDPVSSAGAQGMFQFLPGTYTGLGFPAGTEGDPNEEVKAYIVFMKQLLAWSGGNVQKALAAYNAGQGNWQAGIGYADTILSAAKEPDTDSASSGSASSSGGTGNPIGWIIKTGDSEFNWFGGLIRGVTGTPSTIGDVATGVTGIVRSMTKLTDLFLLLFRPEFWLRIGAFIFGVIALGAGLYFFKESLGLWPLSQARSSLPR